MGLSSPPARGQAGPAQAGARRAPLLQSRSPGAGGSAPASHQVPALGLRAGAGRAVGRRSFWGARPRAPAEDGTAEATWERRKRKGIGNREGEQNPFEKEANVKTKGIK